MANTTVAGTSGGTFQVSGNTSVGTATGGTATFGDKNANTGVGVTGTGFTLGGEGAANYNLTTASLSTTADIAKKNVSFASIAVGNKTYDGTTAATITGYGSLTGVFQISTKNV